MDILALNQEQNISLLPLQLIQMETTFLISLIGAMESIAIGLNLSHLGYL